MKQPIVWTEKKLRDTITEAVTILLKEDADSRARHRTENFLRNGRVGQEWQQTYGRYGISIDDVAYHPIDRTPLLTRNGDRQTYLQWFERQIRNAFFHNGANIKFESGIARILVDDLDWQHPNQDNNGMKNLKKILTLISNQYAEEFDNDLNGMSYDELYDRFGEEVQNSTIQQQEETESFEFQNQGKYNIVHIEDFEDASDFKRYTYPQSRWCICESPIYFDGYTNEGEYTVYFAYVDGFESLRPDPNSLDPTDEYGMSLLCIIVDNDNDVAYSICRYNEAKDGNDMMWDYKELSKILGAPVKQVCPYIPNDVDGEDIETKYRNMARDIDVDDMMDNLRNAIDND